MKMVRSVTEAALATAMLATSITPAMAQGFPGGGFRNNGGFGQQFRHRQNNRIGAGEVIAGVAILGVIAAIASSGSRSRNQGYDNDYRGSIGTEDAAADACAVAAEQRFGRDARVTGIDTVDRLRDGYSVRGTIETGNGRYDRNRSSQQRFTCAVRFGAVERLDIDGGYRGY